ncbi:MAG: DUF805 domain-containing protein [Bacteroidales bacterium]|nr:DUF805 domain-containing protein [Bacteroidales bacterium]
MLLQLCSFKGRARRKEYWLVALCVGVFGEILNRACGLENGLLDNTDYSAFLEMNTTSQVLFCVIYLILILITIATSARRCHDLGHNGWWQLIPFYGIWMAFVPGESGTNKYGPDPKEMESVDEQ